jgi:diketogulonate reductase-like aldo/keto reductase
MTASAWSTHGKHFIQPGSTLLKQQLLLKLSCRRGLEALVDEGLVAALGLSNCSLAQVEEVLAAAEHKPVCNQVGALQCSAAVD